MKDIYVLKKDRTKEKFDSEKIKKAVTKSAARIMYKFSDEEYKAITDFVENGIENLGETLVPIATMHSLVEAALDTLNPAVARSYREYRNYKQSFIRILDEVYQKAQSIMYIGDKENSNTDSALVATKRSLIYNQLNKELYQKFFLTTDELQACRDGYIYIHDMSARRDTMNCCLADIGNIMKGGFEMGNLWYNEPNTLDAAFDVIGDLTIATACHQYGGYTIPQIDDILQRYAEKSYDKYFKEASALMVGYLSATAIEERADKYAMKKVEEEFRQGWQGLEYKLNSVGSSRGDYPFVTVTFGLNKSKFGKLCNIVAMKNHMGGQGKEGTKRPTLFPKYVFLYDENLHGEGKELEDVFEAAVECSSKTMYPDYLSLTGDGYIPSMYKKYGKVISPMGCADGEEVIKYKIGDKIYVESFKRFWKRIMELTFQCGCECHKDDKMNTYVTLKSENVFIWDTKLNDFTKVEFAVRNYQSKWVTVELEGRVVEVTDDHPFEVEDKGVVLAKDLSIGDKIICATIDPKFSEPPKRPKTVYPAETIDQEVLQPRGGHYAYFDWKDFNSLGYMLIDSIDGKYYVYGNGDEISDKLDDTYDKISFPRPDMDKLNEIYGDGLDNTWHIPSFVFNESRHKQVSFLAGMIDAQGALHYVPYPTKFPSIREKLPKLRVEMHFFTKEIALQTMALAQSLDMQVKIKRHLNTSIKNESDIHNEYHLEFIPTEELMHHIRILHGDYHPLKQPNVKNTQTVVRISARTIGKHSYDVQTESEHFELSSLYSHNCRAFLSPWYEKGGMNPADDTDVPVFVGRFNIGAISLHLPMIYAKAKQECKDFHEVLDYYLEMIRNIHIRTYEYLGEMRASVNPVMYCEGGFYGGHLKPHDKIAPLLKAATASFGITALNELQQLHNHHSLVEDHEFALETLKYINKKITEFKQEDGNLYAIYGTPRLVG